LNKRVTTSTTGQKSVTARDVFLQYSHMTTDEDPA